MQNKINGWASFTGRADKRTVVVALALAVSVLAVLAFVAGTVTGALRADGQASGVTSTVTRTATVTVTPSREYAEDSLPDEFYRWLDAHPGADLFGPRGGANAYAPGHHGCYAATSGDASLVMCPDGYRADQ